MGHLKGEVVEVETIGFAVAVAAMGETGFEFDRKCSRCLVITVKCLQVSWDVWHSCSLAVLGAKWLEAGWTEVSSRVERLGSQVRSEVVESLAMACCILSQPLGRS